ncbi:MAG: potassium/proton antiporter [Lentisphaeria bacterium]|nr:potassium/proton antiporter [Lentisphaeria bacterium]
MTADSIIAIAGILLLIGAFSNKLSYRFNLPTLLLFLAAGVAAEAFLPVNGAELAGNINFLGIVAMAFILYSGGGETPLSSVRKVALRGIILAIPGVILTAVFLGGGAYFILGGQYPFSWCLLLAALISSTDAAAVFAILRGKGVGLKGKLKPLLELESGSNDPTAAFLTMFMIGVALQPESAAEKLNIGSLLMIILQLGGGIIAGWLLGWLGRKIFTVKLEYEGLYFVVSVAWVLISYGVSQLVGANGFMACYVCGMILNSGRYNYQKALSKFHNGVAWLMQVGLFTLLGFLANPQELIKAAVWVPGVTLGLFLILVARPLAVFICLLWSEYSLKERVLISWVGIRGAAPIVLATFPLAAGVADAEYMFRLIFFMVLISITIQGWLMMPLARWLKLDKPVTQHEPAPLELEVTHSSANQEMREYKILPHSPLAGAKISDMELPEGVLVTMLRRNGAIIPPRGNTTLCSGDHVLIMAETELLREVEQVYFPEQS